ncbi:MAG: hypothetical protein KAW92_10975 [Candidatus Cloacimonetes bacterium]|nr:hypothetical protein [Candidatus Cloacimonadota bacterium]MCK4359241.1 hypothetical protein [Candidatus Cloacimonadota bacterium]
MHYFRIISKQELNSIQEERYLRTSCNEYEPYKEREIICLFESENPNIIFKKYGEALADMRNLKKEDILYIIEINNPCGFIEKDRSQNGWNESIVHFGDIPIGKIKIIGKAEVKKRNPGSVELSPLVLFNNSKHTL